MLHLTHIGFYAGIPYCGTPRNDTDTYQHPAYNERALRAQLDCPDTCNACLKVYYDADKEP